jgi:hypothetical protein
MVVADTSLVPVFVFMLLVVVVYIIALYTYMRTTHRGVRLLRVSSFFLCIGRKMLHRSALCRLRALFAVFVSTEMITRSPWYKDLVGNVEKWVVWCLAESFFRNRWCFSW